MKRLVSPLLVLLVILILGFFWYKEGVLPVNTQDAKPVMFVVTPGSSVNTIAVNLENEKLIRSRLVFYLLVKFKGLEKRIQYGGFRLTRQMSASDIADELTHGTVDVWVTIIEGVRTEEIARTISQSLKIPESVFLAVAKDKEGYLFPDTYLIPKTAKAQEIVTILENNFNQKVGTSFNQGFAKQNLSLNDAITLASLLEREAQSLDDKKMVAGILLNRLAINMPLQVDATVQYALGYDNDEQTWWKKNLTNADLKIDSLYNTYLYPSLPPGPIANPGLDSIQAVAQPTVNDYLYYLTDKNGNMHYAKTLEGHNRNISQYLN